MSLASRRPPRPRSCTVPTLFYVVVTEVQLSACPARRKLCNTVFIRPALQGEVMKKLIFAGAFVSVIASPALAQSYSPEVGSGNIAPSPYIAQTFRSGAPASFATIGHGSLAVVHVPAPHRGKWSARKPKLARCW